MATSVDPSAILGSITEGFVKLPLVQKILFPLILVASVSGIIYVSKWANQPEYAVLFSDLDSASSGAILERLKEQKIAYQIRGDGTTIAITPSSLVHELRISLASEGLPKADKVGFEIFQNAELGTTTFQEAMKWLRAMQGELERTIQSLDAITAARVHITKPEKSVFARSANTAKASVLLKLRPGAELKKTQIKGIAHLVSGSIEGLAPENVSIVDDYGNLLNSPEDEDGSSFEAEATRLQYKREVEKGYVRHIEQMLARVLGPGKVIARVAADIDFSLHEKEEESFDPAGQVLRSERAVEEGVGSAQRGGIPGVVSNLGTDQSLVGPPESSTSARKEHLRNYEVSKAVSRVSAPRGKLQRLSVAVLVDGKYEELAVAVEGETPKQEFIPLEADVLDRIEQVVKSAVGYDPARGDTVTVENIPFHMPDSKLAEQMEAESTKVFILNLTRSLGLPLFVLLFMLLIMRPLVKFLVTPTEAQLDLERLLPTGIHELEQEIEAERAKASVPSYEPSIDLDQLEELMSDNSRIVKENPHQAALLIRYWLNDGRL